MGPVLVDHTYFLEYALNLAKSREGFSWPNPSVACVLVKNGLIIAEAVHEAAGLPHAERLVLAKAGEAARGATLYLTLEPCCHFGKTPPCTEAILSAGLAAVFFAFEDPNPAVSGKGAALLKTNGLMVQHFPLASIDAFYRPYAHWRAEGKPFITVKMAMSFDGKIAGKDKTREYLSNDLSQKRVHKLRYHADAILTTVATIEKDNPRLSARLDGEEILKPLFVLDRQGRLSENALVRQTGNPLTVFWGEAVLNPLFKTGHEIRIPEKRGLLDLETVFKTIGDMGIHHLFIECGALFFQELWHNGLIQEAYCIFCPKILGQSAYSAFLQPLSFDSVKKITWSHEGDDAWARLDF